jgi:hypothetical protein
MTTKTLTGTYPAGYTLNPSYSALIATTTAQVGGIGIVANALATVTNSGTVVAAIGAAGAAERPGIDLSGGGEVVNFGAVAGGQGDIGVASTSYDGGVGGDGVDIASGSVTNHGSITGSQGGAAGKTGASGGPGGNGVLVTGAGSVTNAAGAISGGAGGSGAGARGAGGAGLYAEANTYLDNGSVIVGGAAGSGHGGYGIEFRSEASVNNTGTVVGGDGAGAYPGGSGAVLSKGGAIDNSGKIMGGAGDATPPDGVFSGLGVGILMSGQGTITNTGTVAGDVGAEGAGIFLGGSLGQGGTVTNGDAGHTKALITGYEGVRADVNAWTVDNFGSIEGTGGASSFGVYGPVTNYESGLISGYNGVGLSHAILTNDGTVKGTGSAGGYGVTLVYGEAFNGSYTDKTALIEGWTGALVGADANLINYGTIEAGASGVAVSLAYAGTLTVVAGSVFEGKVIGDDSTLDLASGVGTISGSVGGVVTLSSMPTTAFDDFRTLSIGGTFTIGTLSGSGTLELGGTADLDNATELTVTDVTQFSLVAVEATSLTYPYFWTQENGTLSVGAGDRMNFTWAGNRTTGGNTFSGTLAGAGTVDFDGGADILYGTTLSVTHAIISEATVTLEGTITLTDTLEATSPQIIVEYNEGGATLSGGGRLELTNAATNTIVGTNYKATLTNDDVIYGAGDLGGGAMTLDNGAAGIIEGDDSVALTVNTGSYTIILNAGLIGAVTALTIDSAVDNTGELFAVGGTLTAKGEVTGGGKVVASGAGVADFTGFGNVFSGALSGTGALEFSAGTDALSSATLSVADLNVTGATVTLSGNIAIPSVVIVSGELLAANGTSLTGAGAIVLTDSASNEITGATETDLLSSDTRIEGEGQLGDGAMELANAASGSIYSLGAGTLTLNTGTSTILNAGAIASEGIGGLTIASPIDNTGELIAFSSPLTVSGAVSGAGTAEVENAASLILKGAFNENVTFATGSTGTLELGDSKGYTTGAITGFSKTGANALDLLDIPFVSGTTTATYSGTTTSGVLTVKDGANVATIHLTGNYTTSTFTVSASSAGGTKVVDPASAPAPLHVAAPIWPHPFIAAMAGFVAREAGSVAIDGALWRTPTPTLAVPSAQFI